MRRIFKNGMGYGDDSLPEHGKRITSPDQIKMDKLYLLVLQNGWWITKVLYVKNSVEMVGLGTKVVAEEYQVPTPCPDNTNLNEIYSFGSKKHFFDSCNEIYELSKK